jgi:hypothetical protein
MRARCPPLPGAADRRLGVLSAYGTVPGDVLTGAIVGVGAARKNRRGVLECGPAMSSWPGR